MRKLVAGATIAALALPAAALATRSPKRNTNCAADQDVTTLTNRDIIDPGFSATEAKVCMTTSVLVPVISPDLDHRGQLLAPFLLEGLERRLGGVRVAGGVDRLEVSDDLVVAPAGT